MCFGDYQKFIGNGDQIGNLLEHLYHENIIFLVLERGMFNLLEMLLHYNCVNFLDRYSSIKLTLHLIQRIAFSASVDMLTCN